MTERNRRQSSPDHPDQDLLADFAAEVLPDDATRSVAEHVHGCPSCGSLLADAEGVRGLLRRQDPVTIPDDVAARLESALARERLQPSAPGGLPAENARPRRDQRQSTPPSGRTGAPATTGSLRALAGREAPTTKLHRMSAEPERARRQALEEQRSDTASGGISAITGIGSRGRLRGSQDGPQGRGRGLPGRALLATAAAVVVLGAGAVALNTLGSGSGGDENTAADAGDSAAVAEGATGSGSLALLSPVLATGTDYAQATLPQQTRTLVAAAEKDGADLQRSAATPAAPEGSAAPLEGAKDAAGNQTLRSAEALRACLDEIGASATQPVAVDLARYGNRDAAVIVLPAAAGGYDVWVVGRDCRPGADGSLAFVTVPP